MHNPPVHSARVYLRSVYRQDMSDHADSMLIRLLRSLQFLYIADLNITDPLAFDCAVEESRWTRSRCAGVGQLAHKRMAWTIRSGWARGMPFIWSIGALPYSCGPRPSWPDQAFIADGTWAEVIRARSMSQFWIEGGGRGCWFFLAKGSGVFLNVGRSLRVANRSELADALQINLTALFEKTLRPTRFGWVPTWRQPCDRPCQNRNDSRFDPESMPMSCNCSGHACTTACTMPSFAGIEVGDEAAYARRYLEINPERLEWKAGHRYCLEARRLGYDTIQLWSEQCSKPYAQMLRGEEESAICFVELINCHDACMGSEPCDSDTTCSQPSRSHLPAAAFPCPTGLPLRTGLNASRVCHCERNHEWINCIHTAPEIPPAIHERPLMTRHAVRYTFESLPTKPCPVPRPVACPHCGLNASTCGWKAPRCAPWPQPAW